MFQFQYPVNLELSYTNNYEYRKQLRELVGMKHQVNNLDLDMDEVSLDENNYDESAMNAFIEYLWKLTKDNYELQELYKLASATMMTLDSEIGIVVLMSYDYLKLFHKCIISFLENRDVNFYDHKSYNTLCDKLKY